IRAGRSQDLPCAIVGAPERQVTLEVPVVVPYDGDVVSEPPLHHGKRLRIVRRRAGQIPVPFARAVDTKIELAVTVVIPLNGNIAREPPLNLYRERIVRA